MKIYNNTDAVGVSTDNPPWYRRDGFPLVPVFWLRHEDENNCKDFGFSWLFFTGWTQMSPDISIEIKLDDIGLNLSISIPYFRLHTVIRLFPKSIHQRSWRTKNRNR